MEEVMVDDLRPITLVMYAAALIPGGELIFFKTSMSVLMCTQHLKRDFLNLNSISYRHSC
jgi:hypothetical protein